MGSSSETKPYRAAHLSTGGDSPGHKSRQESLSKYQHMNRSRSSYFEIIESSHHHTFASLHSDTHIRYQGINTPGLSAQTNIFTLSCLNALTALHVRDLVTSQLYIFEPLHTGSSDTDLRLHTFIPSNVYNYIPQLFNTSTQHASDRNSRKQTAPQNHMVQRSNLAIDTAAYYNKILMIS